MHPETIQVEGLNRVQKGSHTGANVNQYITRDQLFIITSMSSVQYETTNQFLILNVISSYLHSVLLVVQHV